MEVVVAPSSREYCNVERNQQEEVGGKHSEHFDYSQRGQWLRAVVLGGNEGLVSTALLVIGAGRFGHETKALIITGLAGLFAGAMSMATAEIVSVYTQVDVMNFQTKRDLRRGRRGGAFLRGPVPSPTQIAMAASAAYVVGGVVPLLAAGFITSLKVRFLVLFIVASLSMLALGWFGARLGSSPIARSCARVLFGGCIEIMIILGKTKLLQCFGL
ncbi:vacuolar iron transporter homolog 2-like [Cornus florida]|uniref:vacuolar iron transporter homolog 2-like n=1 Tax=Cornus florida TaxID=4283 RepID=UPI00289C6559|nr:vacuolar iron transporter homolog 2-like [Cornus florida]